MSQQQPATVSVSPDETGSSGVFETPAYRNAIDKLSLAFGQRKAAVVVTAAGQSAVRYVTRQFVSELEETVTLIRVEQPCEDVVDLMRHIIRAIGFEPRELGVADLDKVFRLFLSFQKSHNQRTILAIGRTGENNAWVLDKIRHLIEKERNGAYGLFTVLTGDPGLTGLFAHGPLKKVEPGPGCRIELPPFKQDETVEYVRRHAVATGRGNVDQLFSYEALTLLQELSAGVPDTVAALTTRALEMAGAADAASVAAEHVRRARESLELTAACAPANDDAQTLSLDAQQPAKARLVVRLTADDVREMTLGRDRLLIGRSRLCDIQLDGPMISRHHALIHCGPDGTATIVDLSSTNGTFVDGRAVTEHCLSPGETIMIGHCRIDYLLDDGHEEEAGEPQSLPGDEIRLLHS